MSLPSVRRTVTGMPYRSKMAEKARSRFTGLRRWLFPST